MPRQADQALHFAAARVYLSVLLAVTEQSTGFSPFASTDVNRAKTGDLAFQQSRVDYANVKIHPEFCYVTAVSESLCSAKKYKF